MPPLPMKPLTWQCLTDEPDALGESPFWHPSEHTLYWIDIPGRKAGASRPPNARVASSSGR